MTSRHEIEQRITLGKGLMGIVISKIADNSGNVSPTGENPLPAGYSVHLWNTGDGRDNLGNWIEAAAKHAGRKLSVCITILFICMYKWFISDVAPCL